MKHIKILSLILFMTLLGACSEEAKEPSALKIESINITSGDKVSVPGEITFAADISDVGVKLSTLEVDVIISGKVVSHKSIRTKGNQVNLVDEKIELPFIANMPQGAVAEITFEAINVDGASIKQKKEVSISRPELPETLYFIFEGEKYEMTKDASNENLYKTEAGSYPSIGKGKVATNGDDLENAKFIWGASKESNIASIIEFGGEDISISYPKFIVEQYTFNALTFEVGVIGEELNLSINKVDLSGKDGYMYGQISFTKEQAVEIQGFKDIANEYNRDFFSYENGTLTFTGTSGTWEVYYSPKYKYMWVNKMSAVAPECFWIVGHGFTSATTWNSEYNDGGWDTANPARMSYVAKVADNKYQCSMYINNTHGWESFEFEIYSDREWNKDKGIELESVTGATGFAVSASKGITNTPGYEGFVPGYYRITFDTLNKSANIERIF